MHFWYFFWDNFKKTWYSHWKLVKPIFQKQVIWWKKWVDSFINEQAETVMKTEKEKTDSQIDVLKSEIEIGESHKQEIQGKKNSDKKKIIDLYHNKIETLKNEKKRVKCCFETYSTELTEKTESTNNMFEKLQDVVSKYAEDTKDYIGKQSNKVKNNFDNVIWQTKDFILDDIKRDFLANKAKNESDNWEKRQKSHNGLYIFALFIICIFDVFFWQHALRQAVPGLSSNLADLFWLWDGFRTIVEFIIASMIVAVWIISISVLTDESKKWWIKKQISLACIIVIILVFLWYAYTSVAEEQKSAWLDILQLFFSDNMELIFRILIIPSLFVWDLILKRIDTETLFWRSRTGWYVSKLINRWNFFFKKHWFSKYVEEEKKRYWEILDWLKELPLPWSEDVLSQVEKIESKIMPIYNELVNKRNECDVKIRDIDSKIEDLLQEENLQLNYLDDLYDKEIHKEESLIQKNKMMINVLKEQLWNAYISTKLGINLWLRS